MNVAAKQAAIETIKAGYDRYIIVGQAGADTTQVVQMPGSYSSPLLSAVWLWIMSLKPAMPTASEMSTSKGGLYITGAANYY
ncbi:hypothetical protein [Rhizobium leguminosarum]|uniref:hypothetical protein n=1 Tax=Rhizobium leguminosarum TaxID=384 RepID=UPI001FEEF33C|nr:hypothetical protein [Rhizobium leguminosarum]